MTTAFESLGLDPALVTALKTEKITVPTEIQEKVIPRIALGKDIIFRSPTGTGKTLAYLLPLFEKLKASPKEMRIIILAPTHELVIQIQRQMERLTQNSGFPLTTTPIIGGANIKRQIDKLKQKPQIIVGTPGRILELVQKNKIKSQTIEGLVIDEADRLMDVKNVKPVQDLLRRLPKERQIIMASASMPDNIIQAGQSIMDDPALIQSEDEKKIPASISHVHLIMEQRDKIETLRRLINTIRPPKALVFLNSPDNLENLTHKLRYHGINTESLHGTTQKMERKKIITDFRSSKLQVLIASDIAARGLHIEGITHIFNMDVPERPNDYLHRAGRTGRNGQAGHVISLITPKELPLLRKIEHELKIKIANKILSKGMLKDPS